MKYDIFWDKKYKTNFVFTKDEIKHLLSDISHLKYLSDIQLCDETFDFIEKLNNCKKELEERGRE